MKPFAFAGVFVALVTMAAAGADEPVTIKTAFPKNGEKVTVTLDETTELKVTIKGTKDPVTEKKTRALAYEDEIQGVSNERLPTRVKRHYTKAAIGNTALKIEGKTVQITNEFGDVFRYTVDGKPIDEDSTALLDSEFAKGNREALVEILAPPKPVKLGESWKLDSEKLKRALTDAEFKITNPSGEGTLVKLDKLPKPEKGKPDPKQTGTVSVTIKAQLVSGDKVQFKVKEGTLDYACTGTGVLDGTSPQSNSTAVMILRASGTWANIDAEIELTVTQKRKLEPKVEPKKK